MHPVTHDLERDFPELSGVLLQLDRSDRQVHRMLEEYRALDRQIVLDQAGVEPMADQDLEPLKMRRVQLKDELYGLLMAAKARQDAAVAATAATTPKPYDGC